MILIFKKYIICILHFFNKNLNQLNRGGHLPGLFYYYYYKYYYTKRNYYLLQHQTKLLFITIPNIPMKLLFITIPWNYYLLTITDENYYLLSTFITYLSSNLSQDIFMCV
jgi:hypothetical protein